MIIKAKKAPDNNVIIIPIFDIDCQKSLQIYEANQIN